MDFTLEIMSTQVNLAGMDPGDYVRFDTESHGTVIMVALKEKQYGHSDDQAANRFLVTGGGFITIDGVPTEIVTGRAFSIADGQVTIDIVGLIHIGC